MRFLEGFAGELTASEGILTEKMEVPLKDNRKGKRSERRTKSERLLVEVRVVRLGGLCGRRLSVFSKYGEEGLRPKKTLI
ncbi:hypothetical protein HanXRQr2_Chr03g0114521 [Helianthus annuus]|uniref:Uncharacterized protein n=1 Tax=Helianthus annuus TaxID=4232 RepID=A0A9K3JGV4_HELAN|nr:hypothetical protein HanXRQr2_Chr03g0114521 [Helianthus annuus]KAJ0943974.1 hypothetical protein HanPSC8_Chr03g0110881 [Helianthus annuus]